MRTRGRRLYPDSLAERRLLMSLDGVPMYVPRGVSPFAIARRLVRVARGEHPDVLFVRDVLAKGRPRSVHAESPAGASHDPSTDGQ
jgi:hypothetical protein